MLRALSRHGTHTPTAPQPLAARALDFWYAIADEEADLLAQFSDGELSAEERGAAQAANKRIVQGNTKVLTDLIFHVLLTAEAAEDEDDEVPNLMATATDTLSRVACASGRGGEIVAHILPFAQANFAHGEMKNRDAAIMSLASVQESVHPHACLPARPGKAAPPVNVLAGVNAQVVGVLLGRLTGGAGGAGREPSATVRESICYYLSRVCESHLAHVTGTPEATLQLVGSLQAALEQDNKVAKQAAIALNNIFSGLNGRDTEGEAWDVLFVGGAGAAGAAGAAGGGGARYRTIFTGQLLFNLIKTLVTKLGTPGTPEDVAKEFTTAAEELLRLCVRGAPEDQEITMGLVKMLMGPLATPIVLAGKDAATIAKEKAAQEYFLNMIYTCVAAAALCLFFLVHVAGLPRRPHQLPLTFPLPPKTRAA